MPPPDRAGSADSSQPRHEQAPIKQNQSIKTIKRITLATLAVLLLAGCQTNSPSQYISPRVTGRVVDAQTRQPIKGVQVQRLSPDQAPNVDQAIKGGQSIEQSPAIRTGSDGRFVVASERDLALFQKLGWDSVTIRFSRAGYSSFTATCTSRSAMISPSGEPFINAGEIALAPGSP